MSYPISPLLSQSVGQEQSTVSAKEAWPREAAASGLPAVPCRPVPGLHPLEHPLARIT